MNYILLIGAALNFFAAIKLISESFSSVRSDAGPEDYLFMKIFVAGVAVAFASLYLYLFNYPQFIVPFLAFGASTKSWAFAVSVYLVSTKRIGTRLFIELGLSNGVVAAMFWFLIHQYA